MANVIYYFTGTGNSLYIARQLGKQLGDCRIESMAGQPPARPVGGPAESIGFVFPVHGWNMPRIVRQFVKDLDIRRGTYCFAVANYLGLKFDTLGLLDDVLRQKGAELDCGYAIKQPGNSIASV